MNEEEDYIDIEELPEFEIEINLTDEDEAAPLVTVTEKEPGERMYDKVRDTMIPYGFPRGSDSFATSNIKNQKINQIRATALYTKPLFSSF